MGVKSSVAKIRSSVFILLAAGTLLAGSFVSQANAAVSTSYQIVSSRTPSGAYTDIGSANMRSAHTVNGDGRYVVFSSPASNLVTGDTNGFEDIFVRDTQNNTTTRVSISTSGAQADSYSDRGSISYDGRYVVFESNASNLTTGVTGTSTSHIYMHDLATGTTTLVDSSAGGVISNGRSSGPNLSADGRFIVFSSYSTNLISGFGASNISQVYIKDMHSNTLKALSVTAAGVAGNLESMRPDISCDGNVVAFASMATNLGVPTGQPSRLDLIVVNLGWSGIEVNNVSSSSTYGIMVDPASSPQVSCNGNIVLFTSSSTNVVSPSTPSGYVNVYEYNRLNGSNIQVSLGNGNAQPDTFHQGKNMNASMSDDGRYVAFNSYAHNVDTTYTSGSDSDSFGSNVYIRDVKKSTTETASILSTGHLSGWAYAPALSVDGSTVAFRHKTGGTYAPSRSIISGLGTGVYSDSTDIYRTDTGH